MSMASRATELTADLVRIKSITYCERQAAEYIADFLAKLGFRAGVDEANNAIGELKGKGNGPRLLFLGHHDTVEEGDGSLWTYPPFAGTIADEAIWGRGACDEKGGIGAALAAIERLCSENPADLAGDILFMSTREETSDVSARGVMLPLREGIRADFCICLEPTELHLVLGQKGRVVIEVLTHGKSAHSGVPHEGINAINHMAAVLLELEQMDLPQIPPLGKGTQSVGVIKGGVRPNIVAEACFAQLDRRLVGGETTQSVHASLDAAISRVKQRVPSLRAEVSLRSPFYPSVIPEASPIVALMEQAIRASGLEVRKTYVDFHTDAEWIINEANIPAVIFGPGSIAHAHAANERVVVKDLAKAAEVYYRLMRSTLIIR